MQEVRIAPNASIPLSEGSGRRGVRIPIRDALALARLNGSTPKLSLRGNRDETGPVSPPSVSWRTRVVMPCPQCDGAGLHRVSCAHYQVRQASQAPAKDGPVLWPNWGA